MNATQLLCLILSISAVTCGLLPKKYTMQKYLDHPAVQKFQEYLRIDTSKEEQLQCAVEFWRRQASEAGLPLEVHQPAGKPVLVITLAGVDPTRPSIMLNSHIDVVDVEEDTWTYPPFSAHMDENGDIYGRGTQDTKDLSIQHFEAIRRLKNDNVTLLRNLHMTLMPDEETGGFQGMKPFIDTEEFKALNIGFALDEGLCSPDDVLLASYQDKRPWQMKFTVRGSSAHGGTMPSNTAMEKLQRLIDKVGEYRDSQKKIWNSRDSTISDTHNNLNINIVQGGLAENIVPGKMSLVVDMRLSVSANATEMQDLVDSWVAETGNDTTVSFIRRDDVSAATPLDDSNIYWTSLLEATKEMGIRVKPVVCPATSDMLILRNRGIPAIGLAPKFNTISRPHASNEYTNVANFVNGIDVFVGILKRLGNV